MSAPLTYGEKAVGLTFNPSGNSAVDVCKQGFARQIDELRNIWENSVDAEQKRMALIAIEHAQTAQMWAVKVLTWRV